MRKMSAATAAVALITGAFALQPASAHEIDLQIAGYQFVSVVQELPPDIAIARYVSTPAGPLDVAAAPSADNVASVTNRDQVAHTFTQCVATCDTAAGTPGTLFDETLAPGATISTDLPVGTHTFMCKNHVWMRGQVQVSGG